MLKWIKSLFFKNNEKEEGSIQTSANPYAAVKVWFDENRVWLHWPDKEAQSAVWDELIGIAVETTDEGPFVADVWWHLATKDAVISYPSEVTGAHELLKRLQEMPTFNLDSAVDRAEGF